MTTAAQIAQDPMPDGVRSQMFWLPRAPQYVALENVTWDDIYNCKVNETLADRAANWTLFLISIENSGVAGLGQANTSGLYEYSHASMYLTFFNTINARCRMLRNGTLTPFSNVTEQAAADQLYKDVATELDYGLTKLLQTYKNFVETSYQNLLYRLWTAPVIYAENEVENVVSSYQTKVIPPPTAASQEFFNNKV